MNYEPEKGIGLQALLAQHKHIAGEKGLWCVKKATAPGVRSQSVQEL